MISGRQESFFIRLIGSSNGNTSNTELILVHPRGAVLSAIDDLAAVNISAVITITAGFAEMGTG